MDDLLAPEEWRKHSPDTPDGRWFKDFGSGFLGLTLGFLRFSQVFSGSV
jgi:hypothetical protein